MYPILALAEVLTEGLVFYRRAVTVYRVANSVKGVSDMIDSLTSDELRNHRTVTGDDAFLWLLGRGLVSQVEKAKTGMPGGSPIVDKVALLALTNNNFILSSPDAKSMINSYLYALGAEWQKIDDGAFAKISSLLETVNDKFTVEDPVYQLFKDSDTISSEIEEYLPDLGISADAMNQVLKMFKDTDMAKLWTAKLDEVTSAGRPLYKIETATGQMLIGAKSQLPLTSTEIALQAEYPDQGYSLNCGYLFKQVPVHDRHESIAVGTSITREMTDMMSRQTMGAKGYVQEGGKWIRLTDAKVMPGQDNEPPSFVENQIAGATAELSKKVEDKLSAMARLNRIKRLIK